jgi:dolichol-phosphate mannosyltransferase
MPTKKDKKISWIVPCFNEEESIYQTIKRLVDVSNSINEFKWEIIIIDDGSSDRSRLIVKEIMNEYKLVKLICLSRNFGHQYAVQAGLNFSNGDAAVVIDADLQDPPEIVGEMIDYWEKGYDVVYGRRMQRYSESIFKRLTALIYYRILNLLSEIDIPLDAGDFRLIDRKVIKALQEMPERGRYLRGLIAWCGFKQIDVPYKRAGRLAGRSKYSLKKMIIFALEGITAFSRRPLRLATFFGVFCAIGSFLLTLFVIYIRLFTNSWIQGWAGLAVGILFLSGVQLISLGILGEYIGRIFEEAKSRPMYFVEESFGFDK